LVRFFTAPRPRGTVADAYRQALKVSKWGYVLLPLAAPHYRREGLVHERPSTQGQAMQSPLPAAVEATTSLG